jgi:hypothetical protein
LGNQEAMMIVKALVPVAILWPVAAILLAMQRDEPPRPTRADPVIEEPAARKGDRQSIYVPVPVAWSQPEPPALANADDIEQARAEKPRARNKPAPERNICTRHGMHKQVTRGGRSWRCRR